jgi:hypothetical protein
MKKAIFCLLMFILPMAALRAEVIVEGTHTGDTFLFGTLTVNCKASEATCLIIRTGTSSKYVVNIPGLSDEWIDCDAYSTEESHDGVQVRLYGVK